MELSWVRSAGASNLRVRACGTPEGAVRTLPVLLEVAPPESIGGGACQPRPITSDFG